MENCSNDDAIIGNNFEEDPLDSDMLTLQEEKKEYNCFVCHKIFGKNRSLEEHMSDAHKGITMPIHEENKLYECNICNKRFGRRRYDMIKHIETVHEEKKPYECIICNMRFGGRYDMKKHIETVHEGKKKHEVMKEYKCFVCDKIFKTNKKLKGHMSFAHKEKLAVHEKKKKYGCITCKKSFGKKFEMKKHIESFHNTIPIGVNSISRKAQDILRESLKFDSAIETHSMNIAGTPEKKEKSAKIEKGVTTNCRLLNLQSVRDYNETRGLFGQENLHKEVEFQNKIEQSSINDDEQCAVHEREKQSHCTNLSPSKKNENIEIPTTSSNTVHDLGINPSSKHNCGKCGKSFISGRNLRDHIKNVHERMKSFSCKNCKKRFSQEGALKKHIESVHENKRNFQCPHCKINLSAKDSLAKHISVVHEKKKPFCCDTCNKIFGTKLQLKRHEITKHPYHNGFILLKSLN